MGAFRDACVALGADHYWGGDEASGNPQDSIGTSHGTLTGDAPTYQAVTTAISEGAVMEFPSADGVSLPSTAQPVSGTTPFSIACWIDLTSNAAYQNLLETRGPTTDDGFILYAHPSWTEVVAQIGDGTTSVSSFTGAHTYGTTYLITAVYDGTDLNIYLDDTFKAASTLGSTPSTGTSDPDQTNISGASFPLAIFKGVALDATNVADLHAAGLTSPTTAPTLGTVVRSGMRLG